MPTTIKPETIKASQILPFERNMVIRNLDILPHGLNARFLEVIQSHIQGEYIACQWRRVISMKIPADHFIIWFK